MYISKATLDNGTMRWAAVNSDTDPDSYEERMSLELYNDFAEYISGNKQLPETYRSMVYSDFWKGGMPYLSVSHYPDLNGEAVPGQPLKVFVDGNKLKAKGILFDSPLGHSVFRSLREDKEKPNDDRIRISIGFLDLAHKHGEQGQVWVRDGAFSICPECLQGVENKIYVKGCLIHLALTRVPVNKRTEMVLEEKSDMATKKTRKEDAESIVGKDLAEQIEAKAKVSTQRSDVLIEMSDTESTSTEAEETSEEAVETIADKTTESEPVKLEAQVDKFEDPTMTKVTDEPATYASNLPYGGATTMRDAEKYVEAKNEAIYLMDMWSVFSNVMWNIIERNDIPNKRSAMNTAVDEFKNILTAKAMLAFSQASVELSETEAHGLQPAIDVLLKTVDNSLTLMSDQDKSAMLNPAFQEFASAISDFVTKKSVADEPPAQDNDTLLNEIQKMIQPIAEELSTMRNQIGVLEAKSTARAVNPTSRIPTPKTISANLIAKSEPDPKPGSLKSIIRKSVGITQ